MLTQLIARSAAVVLTAGPLLALAASSTDPISRFGILGAHNHFKLNGNGLSSKDSQSQAGLFYNFGNKMTAEAGLIYQAGVDLKYGKDKNDKLRDFQGDLDLGWRMPLGSRDALDVIGGAGYSRSRYTSSVDRRDSEMINRSPFLKAALGYTHRFDSATVRLEAGVRRMTRDGLKFKVDGRDAAVGDQKGRANPYVEANFLFNTQGSLPIAAGVYYTPSGHQLKINDGLATKAKPQRNEFGAKVGIAF